jgi:hypothetical protein
LIVQKVETSAWGSDTYSSLSDGDVVRVVVAGVVVSLEKKTLGNSRVSDVSSAASSDIGCPFVDTIKAEAILGQGGSLTEAMVEPALGTAVVQGTVDGVAFCGIHGGGGSWPRSSSGKAKLAPRLRTTSSEVEFPPEGETVL